MQVIFLGPPGCGKGTQAHMLGQKYSVKVLSVGNMLRSIAETPQHPKSSTIKAVTDKGQLVGDELSSSVVIESIETNNCWENFIIDGFPRTVQQGLIFEKHLKHLSLDPNKLIVINIQIHLDTIVKRICERFTCSKCDTTYNYILSPTKIKGVCDFCNSTKFKHRNDDNPKVILERVDVYKMLTCPVIEYYNKYPRFVTVSGEESVEEVFTAMMNAISKYL